MYLWNRLYYAYNCGNNPSGYYGHAKSLFIALDKNNTFSKKYVVLDGKYCSQRQKSLLPGYKAGRESKENIYKHVEPFVKELSDCCKTVTFQRADRYEADEVIASWAKYLKDDEIYIYSGDKDLIQLTFLGNVYIGDHYSNKYPLSVIPYTADDMIQKVSKISNGKFKDYKNILKFRVFRGDSSDNIPPVIPRLASKTIVDVIDNWDLSAPLNTVVVDNMINQILLTKKVDRDELFGNIVRNYLLMNLIHIPYKRILKDVKKLSVKKC